MENKELNPNGISLEIERGREFVMEWEPTASQEEKAAMINAAGTVASSLIIKSAVKKFSTVFLLGIAAYSTIEVVKILNKKKEKEEKED